MNYLIYTDFYVKRLAEPVVVDPYYLTHYSVQVGYIPSLILAAREINDKMPELLVKKTLQAMRHNGLSGNIKITVLGITFKGNIPDTRNSKSHLYLYLFIPGSITNKIMALLFSYLIYAVVSMLFNAHAHEYNPEQTINPLFSGLICFWFIADMALTLLALSTFDTGEWGMRGVPKQQES